MVYFKGVTFKHGCRYSLKPITITETDTVTAEIVMDLESDSSISHLFKLTIIDFYFCLFDFIITTLTVCLLDLDLMQHIQWFSNLIFKFDHLFHYTNVPILLLELMMYEQRWC
ncbi:unnamed protein product [Ambrosiozyma monospora]|uniref:Unnamed protein product n=1 Tax=Ambrosiozyma monospora TaxID=43982 RepID=A0ACB5SUQ6_AMBMO|nr:unnamed protein product [Ambrosiozyma monospora]